MDTNLNTPSPEELKAEQEALAEQKEEEIRSKIITEFGFDEVEDFEKIDKLVAREIKHHKDLSQAIGQKVKYRDQIKKDTTQTPQTTTDKNVVIEDLDKKLDEKLNERLENMALESLEYPEDIKSEIKKLAQLQGVSVKKAAQDPYILSRVKDFEKQAKLEESSSSRTNKSGTKVEYSLDNPPNSDMQTEEGRKEFDKWMDEMRKQNPFTGL